MGTVPGVPIRHARQGSPQRDLGRGMASQLEGGSKKFPLVIHPGAGRSPNPGKRNIRRSFEKPPPETGGRYPQGTLGWGAPGPDRVVGSKGPCSFLPGGGENFSFRKGGRGSSPQPEKVGGMGESPHPDEKPERLSDVRPASGKGGWVPPKAP